VVTIAVKIAHRIGDVQAAMARLPRQLHPFGYQRIAEADVSWADLWAHEPPSALQPSALDLERLDRAGWRALMSWFSGSSRATGTKTASSRGRGRRSSPGQLSLDLGL
ncbi:MAG: hypothetical protein RLZZ11_1299, partial [Cyanobacteriota bacterium]